jgi:DinB superfamily
MKRLFIALCLLVSASPLLKAQTLSKEELTRAVEYLDKTRDGVVTATKDLSEAQWSFKPAPDRWSVAEVTEHIAAAEDMLMGLIQSQVMNAPARTEATDVKAIDELVLQAIPDRSHKLKAPEPLIPTNRFNTPTDSLKHFKEGRAKTISFLNETKGLRDHAIDSPLGKKLDGYEWVLFIAAHSDRHTKQINEVKADPNFPKK